jgi:hypothetical protein
MRQDLLIVEQLCTAVGSAGPAIEEDKELLEATSNPILSELRREKEKKDAQDKADLDRRLEELRRSYEDLKKKRFVTSVSDSALFIDLFAFGLWVWVDEEVSFGCGLVKRSETVMSSFAATAVGLR